jgi:CubicO group peptidase (beta-lactamase class C family)
MNRLRILILALLSALLQRASRVRLQASTIQRLNKRHPTKTVLLTTVQRTYHFGHSKATQSRATIRWFCRGQYHRCIMITTTKQIFFASLIMASILVACGGAPSASVSPTVAAHPTIAAPPTVASVPTLVPSATAQPKQDVALQLDELLTKLTHNELFSGSVLIAQDGKILVSKGYGLANREKKVANTPQTKFRLASITKQFTAMAILMLQAQGKLTVQDPICKYISNCPTTWQPITIHHLLTHTSGIPDYSNFPDFNASKMVQSSPAQLIARFKDKPLDFKPGEKWSYSNSGYILLGAIIEQVSGKSYEVFLQEHIFAPLKMADTGYDPKKDILTTGYKSKYSKADAIDMSVVYAAGGLYSTVEDLYRWDQALYTEQLVSKELLDKMFTASDGLSYGYGWFIGKEFDHRVIGHPGSLDGFATIINRYPDDKAVIILLSNQEDVQLDDVEEGVARILFGAK